jgi:hypothetical protein
VEEVHDLYFVTGCYRGIKLRRVRWAGQVARIGENISAYDVLNREPECISLLGITRNKKGRIILKPFIKCRMERNGLD